MDLWYVWRIRQIMTQTLKCEVLGDIQDLGIKKEKVRCKQISMACFDKIKVTVSMHMIQ